ncbi:TetR/AcrR family transcriptional regulator [Actinokineospora sp. HUAS TT18]|uniref:TetR/AcrR family transcriptional regulator n=1 Tax=Actinokineospora sp. HUAS TT18 TaxID=3447451 RepID=UPI003F51BA6B
MAQAPARTRRTAEDRRKQLIGIGLSMLTVRPIHQVTIDEVAAEAGISRSLLFHYFPTKQDYYVEVVRAASRRILRYAAPDDSPRAIVDGYVAFIERRRTQYVGLFRATGLDDWVRQIHDETQDALTVRIMSALNLTTPSEPVALAVRAWWAFAEELAIEWTGKQRTDKDALVDLLLGALDNVIALAQKIT